MTEATLSLPAEPFPFWPRTVFDPSPVFASLRTEQPVVKVAMITGSNVWLITRHEDVRAVLGDPRVSADMLRPGFPFSAVDVKREDQSFLRMDAPEHTVYRRLLSKNFTVKRVEAMRSDIERLVDEKLDEMLAAPERHADLVQSLALPVPSTVLSWVLGVPAEDRDFFNKAAEELLNADPLALDKSQAAQDNIKAYLDGLLTAREARDEPGDDILGQLVTACRAGEMTRNDALNTAGVLIVAGHDTTASMTALGTLTLLQHPDQMAALRADPALIPDAIEELLRYLTIVHLVIHRIATEDIEIGGTVIPAGEAIFAMNFSANRDDSHYQEAETFDIKRCPRDHLAFGYGPHQCIGQSLARVELQTIFETLLRRIPTLQLATPLEEVPFKQFALIHGVSTLPVSW